MWFDGRRTRRNVLLCRLPRVFFNFRRLFTLLPYSGWHSVFCGAFFTSPAVPSPSLWSCRSALPLQFACTTKLACHFTFAYAPRLLLLLLLKPFTRRCDPEPPWMVARWCSIASGGVPYPDAPVC